MDWIKLSCEFQGLSAVELCDVGLDNFLIKGGVVVTTAGLNGLASSEQLDKVEHESMSMTSSMKLMVFLGMS